MENKENEGAPCSALSPFSMSFPFILLLSQVVLKVGQKHWRNSSIVKVRPLPSGIEVTY